MNKELLQKYADLKQKEREIKAQLEELNLQVSEEIQASGHDKVEAGFGSFVLSKRKTWHYSDAVKEAQDYAKTLQKEEQADGTATYDEATVLVFTVPKKAESKV